MPFKDSELILRSVARLCWGAVAQVAVAVAVAVAQVSLAPAKASLDNGAVLADYSQDRPRNNTWAHIDFLNVFCFYTSMNVGLKSAEKWAKVHHKER